MLDCFNDRARTRYDVAAGKDARARRSAVFVGNEQTACVGFNALCRRYNAVARSLADGDDGA